MPNPETRPTLARTLVEGFGPETVLAAMESPVRTERGLAVEHLRQRMDDAEHRRAVVDRLARPACDAPSEAFLLDALGTITEVGTLPVFERIAARFDCGPEVRRAAAKVVARCFGDRCAEIRDWFRFDDVRRECCLGGDAAAARALLTWHLESGREPDVAFGLLLTPEILRETGRKEHTFATLLGTRFGYLVGTETSARDFEAVEPFLASDLWCVPPESLPVHVSELRARTDEFEAALTATLLGHGSEEPVPFAPQSIAEAVAFCAAVRSLDHEYRTARRFENTLLARVADGIRPALCKHAPFDFCRRLLIDEALAEASQLGIDPSQRGRFLVERAAALLPPDEETRLERLLCRRERWSPRSGSATCDPGPWVFPVERDADAPRAKFRVIGAAQLSRARRFLEAPSPGALAAARLLQIAGAESEIEPLFDFERQTDPSLPTVGSEIQVPFPEPRAVESLAWKQALRALGIPSPRRPEFGRTVEACVPPSRSYLPQVIVPRLLERLGLFAEPVDAALHLSFGGALGDDVRFLLFVQQFVGPPSVRRRPPRLARLLSKGFARRHRDAVGIDGTPDESCRTELRAARLVHRGSEHPAGLHPGFADDVVETCLLVGALRSAAPEAQAAWSDYRRAVTAIVADLPPEFGRLLESDWYESTGEPRDEAFARRLPISQAWLAVRERVQADGGANELRSRFREVRRTSAARVVESLRHLLPGDGHDVRRTACGAPVPIVAPKQ